MPAESVAYQKSLSFAKRIVNLCRPLNLDHQEYVLSKQILRSGTSIGAYIAEARCGYSRKDFAGKIYIALKACSETLYWLELLHITDYLSDEEYASVSRTAKLSAVCALQQQKVFVSNISTLHSPLLTLCRKV